MKFNLNNYVRVKFTEEGQRIREKVWNDEQQDMYIAALRAQRFYMRLDCPAPVLDAEGYCTYQLWDLMQKFGPYMHHMNLLFETEIRLEPNENKE